MVILKTTFMEKDSGNWFRTGLREKKSSYGNLDDVAEYGDLYPKGPCKCSGPPESTLSLPSRFPGIYGARRAPPISLHQGPTPEDPIQKKKKGST